MCPAPCCPFFSPRSSSEQPAPFLHGSPHHEIIFDGNSRMVLTCSPPLSDLCGNPECGTPIDEWVPLQARSHFQVRFNTLLYKFLATERTVREELGRIPVDVASKEIHSWTRVEASSTLTFKKCPCSARDPAYHTERPVSDWEFKGSLLLLEPEVVARGQMSRSSSHASSHGSRSSSRSSSRNRRSVSNHSDSQEGSRESSSSRSRSDSRSRSGGRNGQEQTSEYGSIKAL